MANILAASLGALMIFGVLPSPAAAHEAPWRAGESRMVGVGHCAKGACTKRTYWGSKPHHHLADGTVHLGHLQCRRG